MRNIALLAAAATLALAAGASAQTSQDHEAHHPGGTATEAPPPAAMPGMAAPGAPMQGGMPGAMGGDMPRMMEMMRQRMAARAVDHVFEHIDGQLAYVRAELHITDAQQPQWNAFAEAARSAMGKLHQAYVQAVQPGGRPLPAPEQIDRHIALVSAQLDAMRSVEGAAKPLYAVLSDEQKRTADEMTAEHLRPMMGMMAMRGMMP